MPTFKQIKQQKDQKRRELAELLVSPSSVKSDFHQHLQAFLKGGEEGLLSLLEEQRIDKRKYRNGGQANGSRHQYVITINRKKFNVEFNGQNLRIGLLGKDTTYFSFVRRQGGKDETKKWRLDVLSYDSEIPAEAGTYGEYVRGLGVIVADKPEESAEVVTTGKATESSPQRKVTTYGTDAPLYLKHSTRKDNTRGNKNFKRSFDDIRRHSFTDKMPFFEEKLEARRDVRYAYPQRRLAIKPVTDGQRTGSKNSDDRLQKEDNYIYQDVHGHYNILGRDLGITLEPIEIASCGQHFDGVINLLEGYQEQLGDEIVHGDIKPNNVVIKHNITSLIDFGLSGLVGELCKFGGTFGYCMPETTYLERKDSKLVRRKNFEASKAQDHYALGCIIRHLFGEIDTQESILFQLYLEGYEAVDKNFYKAEVLWFEAGKPAFGHGLFSNVYDLTDSEKDQVEATIAKLGSVTLTEPANLPAIIADLKEQRQALETRKRDYPSEHAALVKDNILTALNAYNKKFNYAKAFVQYVVENKLDKPGDFYRYSDRAKLQASIDANCSAINDFDKCSSEKGIDRVTNSQLDFREFQSAQFKFLAKVFKKYRSEMPIDEQSSQLAQYNRLLISACQAIKHKACHSGYITVAEFEAFVERAEKIKQLTKLQAKINQETPLKAYYQTVRNNLVKSLEKADTDEPNLDNLQFLYDNERQIGELVDYYKTIEKSDDTPQAFKIEFERRLKPENISEQAHLDKLGKLKGLCEKARIYHQHCSNHLTFTGERTPNLYKAWQQLKVRYNELKVLYTATNLQGDLGNLDTQIDDFTDIDKYINECEGINSISEYVRIIKYLQFAREREIKLLGEIIPTDSSGALKEEIDAIKAPLESEARRLSNSSDHKNRETNYDKLAGDYLENIKFIKETRELFEAAKNVSVNQQESTQEQRGDNNSSDKPFPNQLSDYTSKYQYHHLYKKITYCAFNMALCTGAVGFGLTVGLAILMTGPLGWAFTGVLATALGVGVLGGASTGIVSTIATCKFWQKPLENRIIDGAKTMHNTPRVG
ncbi:MAG: hypothetical protein CMF50_00635 [Legionellales bacterium]|nr:hypothetical protein [Legionellales bacterium]|tara:strand:- start:21262 stop:24402 length:3141 start_codon:yes stop_codon:yes gene_type:complete